MFEKFVDICTRFKLGTVVAMVVSFILGFSIAFVDAKITVSELSKQNKNLKEEVITNREFLSRIELINSKEHAKVDSLIFMKIHHLNERIEFQNDVISKLMLHLNEQGGE